MSPEEFTSVFRETLTPLSKFLTRRVEPSAVEDLAAEVYEIAWKKRDSIPAGMELAWLYRIAGYLVANHRRKVARRAQIVELLSETNDAPAAEAVALADLELSSAWAQLKPAERRVLALVAFDGLSPDELAVAMGISKNAAAIRLHRARERFASLLAG